jgi:hypothetical protein
MDAKLATGLLRKLATARDRLTLRGEDSRCSIHCRRVGQPNRWMKV